MTWGCPLRLTGTCAPLDVTSNSLTMSPLPVRRQRLRPPSQCAAGSSGARCPLPVWRVPECPLARPLPTIQTRPRSPWVACGAWAHGPEPPQEARGRWTADIKGSHLPHWSLCGNRPAPRLQNLDARAFGLCSAEQGGVLRAKAPLSEKLCGRCMRLTRAAPGHQSPECSRTLSGSSGLRGPINSDAEHCDCADHVDRQAR